MAVKPSKPSQQQQASRCQRGLDSDHLARGNDDGEPGCTPCAHNDRVPRLAYGYGMEDFPQGEKGRLSGWLTDRTLGLALASPGSRVWKGYWQPAA